MVHDTNSSSVKTVYYCAYFWSQNNSWGCEPIEANFEYIPHTLRIISVETTSSMNPVPIHSGVAKPTLRLPPLMRCIIQSIAILITCSPKYFHKLNPHHANHNIGSSRSEIFFFLWLQHRTALPKKIYHGVLSGRSYICYLESRGTNISKYLVLIHDK